MQAHQILDSYLNVDDMLRTQLFYKLGRHSDPKMVGDTLPFQDASTHKFGIPTSNNLGDMAWTQKRYWRNQANL